MVSVPEIRSGRAAALLGDDGPVTGAAQDPPRRPAEREARW